MTRSEVIDRYAAKTGRDVSLVSFYETFALFKTAVVLQQIFFRFHRGQTHDERFREFDKRVAGLARAAYDLAEQSGLKAQPQTRETSSPAPEAH
jgi:aminoglycoside phosphotransferase (APT) family kinase protein